MTEPTYALAKAVIDALKADAAVATFVGEKVFDRPLAGTLTPYISMGPSDATGDDVDCLDGLEISFQVDVWSSGTDEAYSSVEARKIAGAVRKALHDSDLDLGDVGLVFLRHRTTRVMRDPDGVTNHAAITFEAIVES